MSHLRNYAGAFVQAMRADIPIYIVVGLYLAICFWLLGRNDIRPFTLLDHYFFAWAINFGVIGTYVVNALGLFHVVHRLPRRRRLGFRRMVAPRRVARYLAGLVLLLLTLVLFSDMFAAIKSSFPLGRGFLHDVVQADIDKALHFGTDPYRLLYGLAMHPWVLRIVEVNYNVGWFLICYFTLFWVVTSPRAEGIRLRFTLTWFSSWVIVGNLVAGAFLSAGPVYYGKVTGDTLRFADQLAFLATSAGEVGSAHTFQAYLWSLHELGLSGLGSGISAFPSMHVALVTLIALFAAEHSRRLGIVLWLYVAFVVLSSVYLGWHYAIDGYASILLVTAIYWALRKGLPWLATLSWRRPSPALAAGNT
jgi:PAP2 superfamily.